MEIEDIEKPIKLDLINIDTGSQELNENMIRNNQILLEIITNSNTSDIREDFQATFKYISAKLPSQVRVPFKGTTMRVFRGGHKFLCGCPDNRIVICNKKEILYDYKTNERVTAIEICENDQYGIIACDFILKKFDLGTFEVVASYLGHLDKITAIVMSQDEKDIYSSSWDSSVRLSHNGSQTSNKSEIVYTHSSRVLSLSISRDGTHLISGGLDQEIMLFNIPNKKVERVLISPKPFVSCVKFSPKKTYFATSDISFNINIWKFESLSIIKILDGHTDKIRSMKFRTDESVLVTGSKDTNVRVWSIDKNHDEIVMNGHNDSVRAVSISHSEKHVYSLGKDYKILVWKFPGFDRSKLLIGHSNTIYKLLFSKKRQLLYSNSEDAKVIVWDQNTGLIVKHLLHDGSLYAMTLSPDEDLLYVCSRSQKIIIWNLENYEQVKTINLEEGTILTISITPDNRLLITGDEAFRITIWNISDYSQNYVIRSHRNKVWSLIIRENKEIYSGDEDGNILCHSLNDFKLKHEFEADKSRVMTMNLTRNEEILITGYRNGQIRIWSLKNDNCLRTINYHDNILREIYSSVDGNYIFACSEDQKMSIFDLRNLGLVTAVKLKSKIKTMAFSGDETIIAFALDNKVKMILNPLKANEIKVFGPGFDKYKFLKYISDIMLDDYTEHKPEMDQWIIEPFHLNALHFYAYFNLSKHLKAGIGFGDSFFPNNRNETPLTICLNKSYTECTASIFSAMKKIAASNPYSFYYFEDSIIDLNIKGHPGLEQFYKNLLIRFKDRVLPKFCNYNSKLPCIVHSDYVIPKKANFKDYLDFTSEGKDVMYLQALVRIDLKLGSIQSLKFIDSLRVCPNKNILKTKIIQYIIYEKFAQISWFIYLNWAVYMIYLVVLGLYSTLWLKDKDMVFVPYIINIILSLYEMFQILSSGRYYWQSWGNYFDLGQAMLFTIYVAYLRLEIDIGFPLNRLEGAILCICFARGIYWDGFKAFRYISNLLYTSVFESVPFMIILMFSTVSFAITMDALAGEDNQVDFFDWLTMAWLTNIGDYRTERYNSLLMWACHWLFTVLNPIILLNLLISLLGDTFKRLNDNVEIADAIEIVDLIIETESMMFWKRDKGIKEYLQICTSVENLEEFDNETEKKLENLRGQVNNLEEKVNRLHKGRLRRLDEAIKFGKKNNLNQSRFSNKE